MKITIAEVFAVLVILTVLRLSFNEGPVYFNQLNIYDKSLFVIGLVSLFGFWFLMLGHFFNNKKIKNKIYWGFSLFFISWIASIIYYIKYYRVK